MVEEQLIKKTILASPDLKKIIQKRNVLLKEVENLEKLKTLHETVTKFNNGYMKANLIKMRLTNVRETAHNNLSKEKKKRKIDSTDTSQEYILRSRWKDARKMGNEYSKLNKSNYFPTSQFNKVATQNRSQIRLPKTKGFASSSPQKTKSQMTNKSLNFYPARSTLSVESMNLKYRRQQQMRYGTYYSLKNRLKLKDSCGQFDSEYDELLRKCTDFEKNHLEVCGFLEEKFYTDNNFRRRFICLINQTEPSVQDVQTQSNQKQPDQLVEVKTNPLTASPEVLDIGKATQAKSLDYAEQVDENDTNLSNVLREIEETPYVEEFQSFTRVRLPTIQEVSLEGERSETVVRASTYSSGHQLNNPSTSNKRDIADYQSSLQSKPNDQDLQLVPGNTKTDYFEDEIVEVIFQQPLNNISSTEAQKLLFDLYLTFWMSLLKTAIEEITKKEDVDIIYIQNCVARQMEVLSKILHRLHQLSCDENRY